MPRIPSACLKCVFYLYPSVDDATKGQKFGGTGFLIAVPFPALPRSGVIFAVTNWHVACRDGNSVIRVNKIGGGVDIFDFGPEQWEFVPGGHDVALTSVVLDEQVHDFRAIATSSFLADDDVRALDIGPGEDVFMPGRFIDHDGVESNAPALRFGNVSTMPQILRHEDGKLHPSYLVDMHSRSGYSGSPVFVYRTLGQDLTNPVIDTTGRTHYLRLLGVHWGQVPEMWDLVGARPKTSPTSEVATVDGKSVRGWSGMSCVAPISAILNVLDRPKVCKLIADREALASYASLPWVNPMLRST